MIGRIRHGISFTLSTVITGRGSHLLVELQSQLFLYGVLDVDAFHAGHLPTALLLLHLRLKSQVPFGPVASPIGPASNQTVKLQMFAQSRHGDVVTGDLHVGNGARRLIRLGLELASSIIRATALLHFDPVFAHRQHPGGRGDRRVSCATRLNLSSRQRPHHQVGFIPRGLGWHVWRRYRTGPSPAIWGPACT